MSEPITLPGSLPGLLRRGSPIIATGRLHNGRRGIVSEVSEHRARILLDGAAVPGLCWVTDLALDLSDPLGQVCAAWWARSRMGVPKSPGDIMDERLTEDALTGHADPADLRDLCMRLANLPTPEPR